MSVDPQRIPPAHPIRERMALVLLILVGAVILVDSVLGLFWMVSHPQALHEAGTASGLATWLQWLPPLLAKLLYAVLLLARMRWIFLAQAAWFLWYLRFAWAQASGADLPAEFYLGVGGHLFLGAIGLWLWRAGVLQGWQRR